MTSLGFELDSEGNDMRDVRERVKSWRREQEALGMRVRVRACVRVPACHPHRVTTRLFRVHALTHARARESCDGARQQNRTGRTKAVRTRSLKSAHACG